jgi:hypothetical protein
MGDHRQEKGWRHYVELYQHLSEPEYAAQVTRTFRACRHVAVPPHIQDVLYKNLVSGHGMGPDSMAATQGREKPGSRLSDGGTCRRCGCKGASGFWEGADETMEHGFSECSKVAKLFDHVITNWNENMYEMIGIKEQRSLRTTLAGDRGIGAKASTEEAWRVVHAATVWVIYKTRLGSRNDKEGNREHLKAPAMFKAVINR